MPLPARTQSFKLPYYFLNRFSGHFGGIFSVINLPRAARFVIRSPGFVSTCQFIKKVIKALSLELIEGVDSTIY
jgi:hypothetical protein